MKKLIIVLALFFLTGCTAEYRLTLKQDMTVKERLWIKEYKGVLAANELKPEEYLQTKIDIYDKTNLKLSKYTSFEDEITIGIKEQETYTSLTELFNNSEILNKYDFSYQINQEDDTTNLVIVINNDFNEYYGSSNEPLGLKNIDFVIELPFEVISTNADKKSRNQYFWSMDYLGDNKRLELRFKDNNLSNNYIIIAVLFAIIIAIGLAYFANRIYKKKFS